MTARHYSNSQNLIISFGYSWFLTKTFLIFYPSLENSTTSIVINVCTKEINPNFKILLSYWVHDIQIWMLISWEKETFKLGFSLAKYIVRKFSFCSSFTNESFHQLLLTQSINLYCEKGAKGQNNKTNFSRNTRK